MIPCLIWERWERWGRSEEEEEEEEEVEEVEAEANVYGCNMSKQSRGAAAAAAGGPSGGGPTCSMPKKMVPSGATDASRSTSHSNPQGP